MTTPAAAIAQHDNPNTDPAIETATQIREHLRTIRDAWDATEHPASGSSGNSATVAGSRLPGPTIVLRADITLTLAFWTTALTAQWPTLTRGLEQRPVPTTDPGHTGWTLITVDRPVPLDDVNAMAWFLDGQADRVATWHTYGPTLAEDLRPLAAAARAVARPRARDKITLGPCPDCGTSVQAKPPRWVRLPIPTTDPEVLAPWTPWQPADDQPLTCRGCHATRTLLEWRAAIVGTERLLTAVQLVEQIHQHFGLRYSPTTIRVWQRRKLIQARGQSRDGQSLFDRVQVFAALMAREGMRLRSV